MCQYFETRNPAQDEQVQKINGTKAWIVFFSLIFSSGLYNSFNISQYKIAQDVQNLGRNIVSCHDDDMILIHLPALVYLSLNNL